MDDVHVTTKQRDRVSFGLIIDPRVLTVRLTVWPARSIATCSVWFWMPVT